MHSVLLETFHSVQITSREEEVKQESSQWIVYLPGFVCLLVFGNIWNLSLQREVREDIINNIFVPDPNLFLPKAQKLSF